MQDENEKTNEQAAKPTAKQTGVLVRLTHDELDQLKGETGATADATAVACFVRKNLRGKRG